MALKVLAAGLSDVGLVRDHNEDSFAVLDHHRLFLVADGMGGHRAGDIASLLATHAMGAFFDSTTRDDATWPFHFDPSLSLEENRLVTSIKVANRTIYEDSARNPDHRGMGTTVVALLALPQSQKIFVSHVGDSRCYRVRNGQISQLTQDHSLVNEYLRAMPDLPPEQRDELPRNVITRALGMSDTVLVDLATHDALANDIYILCSDGLSGMISDDDIRVAVLRNPSPDTACHRLIALANDRGGEDNITAIVLHLLDDSAPSRHPHPSLEETRPINLTDVSSGRATHPEITDDDTPDETLEAPHPAPDTAPDTTPDTAPGSDSPTDDQD